MFVAAYAEFRLAFVTAFEVSCTDNMFYEFVLVPHNLVTQFGGGGGQSVFQVSLIGL